MKRTRKKTLKVKGFDHHCDWRKATVMLAKCVVATLQTDGKIGMGSGMVMRVKDGEKTIERWDKDFIEALAFIGIKLVDKKKPNKKSTDTKTSAKSRSAVSGARAA